MVTSGVAAARSDSSGTRGDGTPRAVRASFIGQEGARGEQSAECVVRRRAARGEKERQQSARHRDRSLVLGCYFLLVCGGSWWWSVVGWVIRAGGIRSRTLGDDDVRHGERPLALRAHLPRRRELR